MVIPAESVATDGQMSVGGEIIVVDPRAYNTVGPKGEALRLRPGEWVAIQVGHVGCVALLNGLEQIVASLRQRVDRSDTDQIEA